MNMIKKCKRIKSHHAHGLCKTCYNITYGYSIWHGKDHTKYYEVGGNMNGKTIKYIDKDNNIKEGIYDGEDSKGFYLLIKKRKRPKHITFNKIIKYKQEEGK